MLNKKTIKIKRDLCWKTLKKVFKYDKTALTDWNLADHSDLISNICDAKIIPNFKKTPLPLIC